MPTPPVVVLIPARGGSQGIPRKNLQEVGGVPLVARSVRAALAAQLPDRVVVTTDDEEIADAAAEAGAEIVLRPPELSTATASSESALVHALESLGLTDGIMAFLQCTSPFTTPAIIDGVVDLVATGGADSSLTVVRSHTFLWRDGATGAEGVNHDPAVRLRRQDLEPEFAETGAAYASRIDAFLEKRHRFFGRIATFETSGENAIEIDDPGDLDVCRALARESKSGSVDQLAEVKALAFDFDGVFTDDLVHVDETGREAVTASRRDGLGIERLRRAGVPLLVISKERNPVVAARCKKLQIEVQQGIDDKLPTLKRWADSLGLELAQLGYVGNDVNDIECLDAAGVGIVVSDAHPAAREHADMVLGASGGRGAIRELSDHILENVSQ